MENLPIFHQFAMTFLCYSNQAPTTRLCQSVHLLLCQKNVQKNVLRVVETVSLQW